MNPTGRRIGGFWPFAWLRQRKYQRRFYAALVILIGRYVYDELPDADKKRVQAEVDANFVLMREPPGLGRKIFRGDGMSVERALAMERLGLPTRVKGLHWQELLRDAEAYAKPLRVNPGFSWESREDFRAGWVGLNAPFYDVALEDAKTLMRENGYNVPAWDPPQEFSQIVP